MSALLEPNSPFHFFIAFILVWIGVCLLLSIVGGWWLLAKHYRSTQHTVRKQWLFQTAVMRWLAGYGNCLKVGVSDSGLALSVLFLFRPGHPPLLVPWEDIRAERHNSFPIKGIRLTFRNAPGIPLILREGLAKEINSETGGKWNELFT